MKKSLLLMILSWGFGTNLIAQVPELWGTTFVGGIYGKGTIFKINGDGSGDSIIYSFGDTGLINPNNGLLQANNGKLYGTTSNTFYYGMFNFDGGIFSIDPNNYDYTRNYRFGAAGSHDGNSTTGHLCQANDGKLYGATWSGGSVNAGIIYSINPSDNSYSIRHNITHAEGGGTSGGLMQANNGKLYGLTRYGSDDHGNIYSYDITTDSFTNLFEFDSTYWWYPDGELVQANNGKLYGMTLHGGIHDSGIIFSFDISNNTFNKVHDFLPPHHYAFYRGKLLLGIDDKLYGTTAGGGADSTGIIFSFNPTDSSYSVLYNFSDSGGYNPAGGIIQASDNKIYGTTSKGGANGFGNVFGFDLTTNIHTVLLDFDTSTLWYPAGGLVEFNSTLDIKNIKDKISSFNISPNPATTGFTISIDESLTGSTATVTDITGREITNSKLQTLNTKLETGSFSNGIYFITVSNGSQSATRKLVVSK